MHEVTYSIINKKDFYHKNLHQKIYINEFQSPYGQ